MFYDEEARKIDDPDHSKEEDRFIILGTSIKANLLVVCHCYKEPDLIIRIISARRATSNEIKQCQKFMREGVIMREEYDFWDSKKNPYAKKLKKQITIKIDEDTIVFFKNQSENSGIPYQTLINLYLADCAKNNKQLQMSWQENSI